MPDPRSELLAARLAAQRIAPPRGRRVADVVAWMGAIQAQDYLASLWAVALRLPGAITEAQVEQAIAGGEIVRVHAFRGTWQLIAPADVRWLLELVGPRLIAGWAGRFRQLGLGATDFRRSEQAMAGALAGGRELTRTELAAAVRAAGVATDGQRMAHMLVRAELAGLLCGGARRGKQFTYALLDDRVPARAPALPRHQAVAELTRRYLRSRGPATDRDLAWWTGLPLGEVREAIESIGGELRARAIEGQIGWSAAGARAGSPAPAAHLLPPFDEYLIAYRDRSAMLDAAHIGRINAGGGMLGSCILVDGRVAGTWRRTLNRKHVLVELQTFVRVTRAQRQAIEEAAHRYGRFLGLPAQVRFRTGLSSSRRARAGNDA